MLSPGEQKALEGIAAGDNQNLAHRARIILSYAGGQGDQSIAETVGLTPRTVRKWIRAFEADRMGIFPGLEPAPRGEAPISVADLCARHQVDMAHGRAVASLAAGLFRLTGPLHKLDAHYEEIAYKAGLLHNVAFAGGVSGHHTRGRDILLTTPLSDLSDTDRTLIALTTLFHRKRWKASRLEKEESYQSLPADLKPVAIWLAALVRVADGLDYSHSQATLLAESTISQAGAHITVVGPYAEVDAGRADSKADMWRALLSYPLRVTPHGVRVSFPAPVTSGPLFTAETPMSSAGYAVFSAQFERMTAYEEGAQSGEDIEDLHRMRVAIRRMRAAFQVFGRYFPEADQKWVRKGLRRAGEATAPARDWDVLLAHLEAYRADLPDREKALLDPLVSAWSEAQDEARKSLVRYIDGKKYGRFKTRLADFLAAGPQNPEAHAAVREALPGQIRRRYEAMEAAYGKAAGSDDPEDYHDLRIAGKKVRYTLEFARDVLGDRAEAPLKALVAMQDQLGALNDSLVAGRIIRDTLHDLNKNERISKPETQAARAYRDSRLADLSRRLETFPATWENMTAHDGRDLFKGSD